MMVLLLVLALASVQPLIGDDTMAVLNHMKEASDAWKICTAKTVHNYALTTKEPAETVVNAAIGHCMADFDATRNIMATADHGRFMTRSDIDDLMTKLTDGWRPKLLDGVFKLRAR
jgi:hypothetical protein